jgi:predicted kinase
MIIFMAGYPKAGKSFVVDLICEKTDKDILVISPKECRDDNYDDLDEDDKREMDISAWSASLDILWEQLKSTDDTEIIIYDTACASLNKMKPYFEGAKEHHTVVYVFVQASLAKCKERAGSKWLPGEVVNSYTQRFKEDVKTFKELSDYTVIVKNNSDDVPNVDKIIGIIKNGNDRIP